MQRSCLVLILAAACVMPVLAVEPDAVRAAEARALRAQIDQMDTQMRDLADQLHAIETAHPTDRDGRDALRQRIHDISSDQQLLESRLRELERPQAAGSAAGTNPVTPSPPPPSSPPQPQAPPPVAAAPAVSLGPPLRKAADPAIYLKAAGDRRSMFNYNPYRWIPVGTRQLAVYNDYNDAVLLDLENDCPTLLTARKIDIENFSTRVYVNKSAVVADGVRCVIVGIRELYTNRLP